MARIALIHWNVEEAEQRARRLRAHGHQVMSHSDQGGNAAREAVAEPPDVVVIDLSRLPSHGRECGIYLRGRKATRHLPLVFVGGAPEKVARVEAALPDAVYTPWSRIRGAVKRALSAPPREPIVPTQHMAGYSGTPLVKKLGLREGHALMLLGAPADFAQTLGELPPEVATKTAARGPANVVVLFAKQRATLEKRFPAAQRALQPQGGLWVAWPKQSSGVETDVTQSLVRAHGLAAGLVDNKICAIDATWSALRFAHRRTKK